MDIGDPTIYKCPLCGKSMQMTNWTSYTVSSSKYYSDGEVSQSGICVPDFTPDLAKCPHCKGLFFRHNVKDAETVNFYVNNVKEEIEEPTRDDLISAVKNKLLKKQQEVKTLREMVWRSFNEETRQGYNELKDDDLSFWKDNCAALLMLTEKKLKQMQSGKNSGRYEKDNIESCLLMTAELNRNLGNFDRCMEFINQLGSKWGWLKKQFAWECKGKNIYTFQLMSKKEMNLEKSKEQYSDDYYNRAKKYLPPFYGRRDLKKVLADLKKAEDLGMNGIIFYRKRGDIYLEELNDPDNAIADYDKALKQKDKDEWIQNYISGIIIKRSKAYQKKGNFKKALEGIQSAIEEDNENHRLYLTQAEIYEAMGDIKAAQRDKRKAEEVLKKEEKERKAFRNKTTKKSKRKKNTIDEL